VIILGGASISITGQRANLLRKDENTHDIRKKRGSGTFGIYFE